MWQNLPVLLRFIRRMLLYLHQSMDGHWHILLNWLLGCLRFEDLWARRDSLGVSHHILLGHTNAVFRLPFPFLLSFVEVLGLWKLRFLIELDLYTSWTYGQIWWVDIDLLRIWRETNMLLSTLRWIWRRLCPQNIPWSLWILIHLARHNNTYAPVGLSLTNHISNLEILRLVDALRPMSCRSRSQVRLRLFIFLCFKRQFWLCQVCVIRWRFLEQNLFSHLTDFIINWWDYTLVLVLGRQDWL